MKQFTFFWCFVWVLFVPLSLAYAGELSKEGMPESGSKTVQDEASRHIWFSPGQKVPTVNTSTMGAPEKAQGKAGVIGDCGVKGMDRDNCVDSRTVRSRSGVRSSDPVPVPEPVDPNPDTLH